jgi:hypothetical protein
MENLAQLNFDPEFCDRYEKSILALYNQQTGKRITPKRKRRFAFINR